MHLTVFDNETRVQGSRETHVLQVTEDTNSVDTLTNVDSGTTQVTHHSTLKSASRMHDDVFQPQNSRRGPGAIMSAIAVARIWSLRRVATERVVR